MSQKYNPFLNTKSPRSMDTPLETYGRTYGRKFFLLEDMYLPTYQQNTRNWRGLNPYVIVVFYNPIKSTWEFETG